MAIMKNHVSRYILLYLVSIILLSPAFGSNAYTQSNEPKPFDVDPILPDFMVFSLTCDPVKPSIVETAEYTAVVKITNKQIPAKPFQSLPFFPMSSLSSL
jgi:hypothetical protein